LKSDAWLRRCPRAPHLPGHGRGQRRSFHSAPPCRATSREKIQKIGYDGALARYLLFLLIAGGLSAQTPAHLSGIKQLTPGGENAEAYWSPDSKQIIFQSTRDKLGCDQIFIMNADGSNQHMVSTGKGRTTCGYFLADNQHILYASTHEAGSACPAPADRSKGYVWAVYPTYKIYLATLDGKIVKTLAGAPGYNAEATVNRKTGRIVYTSMQSGDLDVWTMNPDGSDKKQITKSEGYDGGPVFSPDGKMILWRGNHPATPEAQKQYRDLLRDNLTSPMKMELFVSDAEGKNTRKVTNYGCASFAPTFTPDGKKILFSSNKHDCDGRKFELYLMNVDGTGLEQVTNFGWFTAFPEFSPDGKKIVFVSDKDAKARYEFNIFTAEWK
jgi:TolB protein